MKLRNLINKIESKYPTNLAYSWDNVGLLVGEYEQEVKKILVTLEANEKVVDEAIEKGVDLIITHHPFIFSNHNPGKDLPLLPPTVLCTLRVLIYPV